MRKFFTAKPNENKPEKSTEKDLRGLTISVNGWPVTIENKIAEGGFSFVYVVRCNKTGRYYALKRQFVNEQRLLEACRREIEITRTLGSHANIVTYVASSLQPLPDGVHEYLLLTHYYRNSVLQLMNERLSIGRTLTVNEIVSIFCDVCSAVARLHHCQTPVIHRDLKVENLLLDADNVCVLCDFGSATTRVLSTQSHPYSVVDEEISRFTTLSYRSPEMVDLYSGVPITTKADVWALGVMLFKLCYFALPFGESALAIQNATFAFPGDPEYPAEILALIVYMLTPDANRRPDIYQVSSAIFNVAKRDCPVKNLNNCDAPSVSHLFNLLTHHKNRQKGTNEQIQNVTSNHSSVKSATLDNGVRLAADSLASATTSVVPRQRPKVQTVCSPAIPLVSSTDTAAPAPWKLQNNQKKTDSPANDDSVASSQSLKENSDTTSVNINVSNNSASSSVTAAEGHSSLPRPTDVGQSSAASGANNNGHRRNVSDPSAALAEGDRCSAFRPYHSQQQVSANKERSNTGGWNPFDLDDHSFGLHFDELPRRKGSASSTANVKSRESLVMMVDDADPFGAAPFTPNRNNSTNARISLEKQKTKTKKSAYEKLINTDEAESSTGAVARNRLRPKERDEVESIGSASDLQARMQVSSTTDDDEDGSEADPKEAGLGAGGRSESGDRSSGDPDNDARDRIDPIDNVDQAYNEPNELQGRRPLLAEDEDDAADPTEAFEMNILSPGSTDTMIGPPAPGGFGNSPIYSEVSFAGDVFLNAPFKTLFEASSSMENRLIGGNRKSIPATTKAPPSVIDIGRMSHHHHHHHKLTTPANPGGGDGSSKNTAFINSTFQGDDAFRS